MGRDIIRIKFKKPFPLVMMQCNIFLFCITLCKRPWIIIIHRNKMTMTTWFGLIRVRAKPDEIFPYSPLMYIRLSSCWSDIVWLSHNVNDTNGWNKLNVTYLLYYIIENVTLRLPSRLIVKIQVKAMKNIFITLNRILIKRSLSVLWIGSNILCFPKLNRSLLYLHRLRIMSSKRFLGCFRNYLEYKLF